MSWLRRVLANLGLVPRVAKSSVPSELDALRAESREVRRDLRAVKDVQITVDRRQQARMNALDLQVEAQRRK